MRKDAMLVGLRPCLQAKRSDPNWDIRATHRLQQSFVSIVFVKDPPISSLCQICTGLNCDIAAFTKGIPYRTDATK
jgi:hypothetical protein